MRSIREFDVLIREPIEIPARIEFATEEFREGWSLVDLVDTRCLENIIDSLGWRFIRNTRGSLSSGVGETSQEAIAGAIRIALGLVNEHFNAVEVEHIALTQYPWFFLAKVRVCPYQLQQNGFLAVPDEAVPTLPAPRRRLLPADAAALYPQFASALPQLKQMLISSQDRQARPQ
jgi:hypothetical protein